MSFRTPLALGLALVLAAGARAQDPINVAYWNHAYRPANAFTPPPMPIWCYGPQPGAVHAMGPYGRPEAGVQTPFMTPDQIPRHGRHGRGAGGGGPPTIDSLPMHQYIRSPRDFFMFYENLEAERSRELRPQLIP